MRLSRKTGLSPAYERGPSYVFSLQHETNLLSALGRPMLDFGNALLTASKDLFAHLITLSALDSTFGGIVRPISFAVLRLITSSNFVGCSTGRSAGLAPLRILSTKTAARRKMSSSLAP